MKPTKKQNGFTLIELLVVIAIIALLLSIVMPALSRAKLYAQKILCGNDVRQQGLGTLLYSNDNDSAVPRSEGGNWLWDVSFWCTNELSLYAGFDDNKTYFCPANKSKQHDDARFWQFSLLYGSGGPYTQKEPLRDESNMHINQLKSNYRVLPYVYMWDKYDPSTGDSLLPATLVTGEPARWITKLSDLPSASSKEMIFDAIISANNQYNFFDIRNGGMWDMSGETLSDNSNHLSRQTIRVSSGSGPKPDGSQIVFADGHVEWRKFEDMRHRLTRGNWFWW